MKTVRVKLGPADLKEGQLRGYKIGSRNVVVAFIDGQYTALDDWCNHAGCLLSGGRLERHLIVCPCHEVGFDMRTGKNATSPEVCDDQRAFRVTVENGSLYLEDFPLG